MSKLGEILRSVNPERASRLRVIILCIFAATTFWFLNALNDNYSSTLKYPIEFIYDRDQYVAVDNLPENVQINVSGLGWNLFRNSLGIKVSPISLPLERPAETNKIVGAQLLGMLSDQLDEFQLNYVLTDTLFLNIDAKISKRFMLLVDSATVSLEENYFISNNVRFTPDSVELMGPSSLIDDLPDTILIGVPQKNIDESYNEDVAINLPNGRLISRNPPTVNIVFAVAEYTSGELIVPLKIENIPDKAYIESESVKATFKIPKTRENEILTGEINAIADFSTMDKSDSTLVPELADFPDFLREVSIDTTRIKVKYNE